MLASKYRRIYHYHLKKCGGSTLNRWLDTLACDDRLWNPAWIGSWLLGDPDQPDDPAQVAAEVLNGHAMFHWADVIHTHAAVRAYAPADTFCFTVLRDPVQRLVSQIADWRRLLPEDTVKEPHAMQAMIAATNQMPLRAMLERYGHGEGRLQLDNYMTRALAAGRGAFHSGDAAVVLDDALCALETDYDLVGLTEAMDLSRNALCSAVGLPPVTGIHRLNVTDRPRADDPEVADAAGILEELTRIDAVVYERGARLFNTRHRIAAERYDMAAFETGAAGRILSGLRARNREGGARYSVKDPLIGSGMHGRDSAGTMDCAVWTGPETSTTLYLPVPPNMQLSLMLWIRGYAALRQREEIWIRVDGQPVVHRFEPAEGYADLLLADVCTTRDFVRLEIEMGETLDSAGAGCPDFDDRKRGLSFDGYGWRLLRLNRPLAAVRSLAAAPDPSMSR